MDQPRQGVLLAFAAYAFSDACIKLLGGALDPFAVAFLGSLLGLAAVPFLRRPGEGWHHLFRTTSRPLWLLRAGAAVTGSVGSVVAFTRLPMAEAFALIFLLPAFVTLLSVPCLGERVGWRRWAAVAVGFAGVLIVLRPGFRELNLGHLGAVSGGLSGAVTVVVMRALGGRERPISLFGAGLFGPILVCGALALPGFVWPTAAQWGVPGRLRAAGGAGERADHGGVAPGAGERDGDDAVLADAVGGAVRGGAVRGSAGRMDVRGGGGDHRVGAVHAGAGEGAAPRAGGEGSARSSAVARGVGGTNPRPRPLLRSRPPV